MTFGPSVCVCLSVYIKNDCPATPIFLQKNPGFGRKWICDVISNKIGYFPSFKRFLYFINCKFS